MDETCTVPFAYLEMKDEERADRLLARFVEAARATAHGGVRIEWSPGDWGFAVVRMARMGGENAILDPSRYSGLVVGDLAGHEVGVQTQVWRMKLGYAGFSPAPGGGPAGQGGARGAAYVGARARAY